MTSADLARKTGLHERWIREWLYVQAIAAGLIDYIGEGRFVLSPESALVLANENSPFFLAGDSARSAAADGRAQSTSRIIQEREGTDLRSTRAGGKSRRRTAAGSVVSHATRPQRAAEARRNRPQAGSRSESRRHWMRRRIALIEMAARKPTRVPTSTATISRKSRSPVPQRMRSRRVLRTSLFTMLASIRSPVIRAMISSRLSIACTI